MLSNREAEVLQARVQRDGPQDGLGWLMVARGARPTGNIPRVIAIGPDGVVVLADRTLHGVRLTGVVTQGDVRKMFQHEVSDLAIEVSSGLALGLAVKNVVRSLCVSILKVANMPGGVR